MIGEASQSSELILFTLWTGKCYGKFPRGIPEFIDKVQSHMCRQTRSVHRFAALRALDQVSNNSLRAILLYFCLIIRDGLELLLGLFVLLEILWMIPPLVVQQVALPWGCMWAHGAGKHAIESVNFLQFWKHFNVDIETFQHHHVMTAVAQVQQV